MRVFDVPTPGFHIGERRRAVGSDIRCRQLPTNQVVSFVTECLSTHFTDEHRRLVVIEKYTITTRTARLTQQSDALEVTGAVKQLCNDADVPVIVQMKSNAAKIASDKVLRGIGWFVSGQRHANDAARHALLALAGFDPIIFEALMTYGNVNSTSMRMMNEDGTSENLWRSPRSLTVGWSSRPHGPRRTSSSRFPAPGGIRSVRCGHCHWRGHHASSHVVCSVLNFKLDPS